MYVLVILEAFQFQVDAFSILFFGNMCYGFINAPTNRKNVHDDLFGLPKLVVYCVLAHNCSCEGEEPVTVESI